MAIGTSGSCSSSSRSRRITIVNVANPQDTTRYELTRHVVLYHTLDARAGPLRSRGLRRADVLRQGAGHVLPRDSRLRRRARRRCRRARRPTGQARATSRSGASASRRAGCSSCSPACCSAARPSPSCREPARRRSPSSALRPSPRRSRRRCSSTTRPRSSRSPGSCSRGGSRAGCLLVAAGLALGTGVLFQYAVGSIAVVVAVYVAVRRARDVSVGSCSAASVRRSRSARTTGRRSARRSICRTATWRTGTPSSSTVASSGSGSRRLSGLHEVLIGDRGLLLLSPVLVAAAVGLWLMWRRGFRGEAAVAAVVTIVFVLADAAYFIPYGGNSPGPRFAVPALPFLMLGLPFALARFPKSTLALAVVSCVLTSLNSLTWGLRLESDAWYPGQRIQRPREDRVGLGGPRPHPGWRARRPCRARGRRRRRLGRVARRARLPARPRRRTP